MVDVEGFAPDQPALPQAALEREPERGEQPVGGFVLRPRLGLEAAQSGMRERGRAERAQRLAHEATAAVRTAEHGGDIRPPAAGLVAEQQQGADGASAVAGHHDELATGPAASSACMRPSQASASASERQAA